MKFDTAVGFHDDFAVSDADSFCVITFGEKSCVIGSCGFDADGGSGVIEAGDDDFGQKLEILSGIEHRIYDAIAIEVTIRK